jgi:hypothetical protein
MISDPSFSFRISPLALARLGPFLRSKSPSSNRLGGFIPQEQREPGRPQVCDQRLNRLFRGDAAIAIAVKRCPSGVRSPVHPLFGSDGTHELRGRIACGGARGMRERVTPCFPTRLSKHSCVTVSLRRQRNPPKGESAATALKAPCGPQSQASAVPPERELETAPEERKRIKGGVVSRERGLGRRQLRDSARRDSDSWALRFSSLAA